MFQNIKIRNTASQSAKFLLYLFCLVYLFFTFLFLDYLNNILYYAILGIYLIIFSASGLTFWSKEKFSYKSLIFIVYFGLLAALATLLNNSDIGPYFPLSFIAYAVVFYCIINIWSPDQQKFLKLSNAHYLLFSVLSIIRYFTLDQSVKRNDLLLQIPAFQGLEGSPAHIDVFSLLILLINFYYNKNVTSRYFFILITIASIVFCGTTAPLVCLLVFWASKIMLIFRVPKNVIFLSYLVISLTFIYYSTLESSLKNVFFVLTNARSLIWEQQLHGFFNSDWIGIFFGNAEITSVEIYWGEKFTNNPHNAYLFLLFRFGVVFTFSLIFIVAHIIKHFTRRDFLIFMALVASGMSGVTTVYISNPYYLTLLFFLIGNNGQNTREK